MSSDDGASSNSTTSDNDMVMNTKMKTVKVNIIKAPDPDHILSTSQPLRRLKTSKKRGNHKRDSSDVSYNSRQVLEEERPGMLARSPARKNQRTTSFSSSRSKKILKESNLADDEDPSAGDSKNQFNFLLAAMLSGISYYYVIALIAILGWTILCTYFIEHARQRADENPELKKWLTWCEDTDVRMIGNLFVFSLVFRFNQCYNRWWQGRMLWGDIIQNCLDFSRKATLWIVDQDYCDRLNRYIIAFPYAAKAQLRGLSLTDETESGSMLVERGYLTQEELDFLSEHPCWEPEFILDLMRAVVAKVMLDQWEKQPNQQFLLLPHANRIHDRLFPPLDKAVYDLGNSIGEGVSVRSAGLPRSYDTVHYIFFWLYFFLAPVPEAATIGWLAPIYLGASSCIIMALMDMGTAMVDPFGTDLVDLPIERFCETVEAQVLTNQSRRNTGKIMEFATHSTPRVNFKEKEPSNVRAKSSINLTHDD